MCFEETDDCCVLNEIESQQKVILNNVKETKEKKINVFNTNVIKIFYHSSYTYSLNIPVIPEKIISTDNDMDYGQKTVYITFAFTFYYDNHNFMCEMRHEMLKFDVAPIIIRYRVTVV